MTVGTVRDVRIIQSDDGYQGWPTVARRRNGDLLVVSSAGREAHICPFGQVHLIRSGDGGERWSAPECLVNGPLDDRDAGILETRQGTLLVNWFTSVCWMVELHRQEIGLADGMSMEKQTRWRRERMRVVDLGTLPQELGGWMIRSGDGGRTWSDKYPTPVNSPHGPTELSDGRLLYVGKRVVSAREADRGGPFAAKGGLCAAESTDDGQTWNVIGDIPAAAGHDGSSYHEPYAVETASGRLVAVIRNHGKLWAGETIQTESDDGGRTWSTPHSIGIWGVPAHLLCLRDGRLVLSYGYRRAPFGNQARISTDEGRTWSEPVVLSADGMGTDLGYPSSVELDDGTILSVWYEVLKGNPLAVLRQARWSVG